MKSFGFKDSTVSMKLMRVALIVFDLPEIVCYVTHSSCFKNQTDLIFALEQCYRLREILMKVNI